MQNSQTNHPPDITAPPARKSSRIPGLDGLRGMAAVLVLLSHISLARHSLLPGLDFSGTGKSGVYLFFVLSAFLLSSQMLSWPDANFRDKKCWSSYFTGRVLRIWPLFLIVVITCLVTTMLTARLGFKAVFGLPVTMDVAAFWQTLILQRGDSVLWTIPVEFKFYFLLPLIMAFLVLPLRRRLLPGLAVMLVALTLSLVLVPRSHEDTSPLPFLNIFFVGIIAALLHQALGRRAKSRAMATGFEIFGWLCAAAYVATIPAVLSRLLGRDVPNGLLHEAHLLFSVIWAGLILGMLHGSGTMRRLFDSRVLAALGTISYSLYLWHPAAIRVLSQLPGPSWLVGWIILAGALVMATISYNVVERPVLAYSARLRKKDKSAQAAQTASVAATSDALPARGEA